MFSVIEAFALSGRYHTICYTQGDTLGYVLNALSGRSG